MSDTQKSDPGLYNYAPYIMELPYWISSFEKLIAGFAERKDIEVARGDAILDGWKAQQ